MYQELLKVRDIVNKILKNNLETRNSDRLPYLKVFEKFNLILTDEQKRIFLKMPVNFESIRRSRQKIQNEEGRFLPIKEVKEARTAEQEKMRAEFKTEDEKAREFSKTCLS